LGLAWAFVQGTTGKPTTGQSDRRILDYEYNKEFNNKSFVISLAMLQAPLL
jgi:hypothetical protein